MERDTFRAQVCYPCASTISPRDLFLLEIGRFLFPMERGCNTHHSVIPHIATGHCYYTPFTLIKCECFFFIKKEKYIEPDLNRRILTEAHLECAGFDRSPIDVVFIENNILILRKIRNTRGGV